MITFFIRSYRQGKRPQKLLLYQRVLLRPGGNHLAPKGNTGGVYAMSGPGFEPVAVLAYPYANIGVFSSLTMEKIFQFSSMSDAQRAVVSALDEEIRSPLLLNDKGLINDVTSVRDTRQKVFNYLF